MSIDWAALQAAAIEVRRHAYVPYSRFRVGAAGLTAGGDVIAACNVENASIGLSLCAECGLVSMLRARGDERLIAVACVDANDELLLPCGRCRQLLLEHGGPDLLVNRRRLAELLPDAFGPSHLDQ
jgi:cytidine deaminase